MAKAFYGGLEVKSQSSISWADIERDTSAWLGNDMQRHAFQEIKALRPLIKKKNDPELTRIWRYLQNSDHLYYACTKHWADGDVHKYFSGLDNPETAYNTVMHVVNFLKSQL